ncbi:MAG: DeoR/GlpR transcriptional regulator [Clostridia bacterium]|nr:DeoR/GlpR transcriptional regulator [Clostridia bacterium]
MNQERRSQVVELINKKGTVTNAELMETFGVSIETVRRDMAFLEARGLIERVYGGAVKKRFMSVEPAYLSREKENADEKEAIAKETEKHINVGDAVFFDIGTTVLPIVNYLNEDKKVTGFTTSLRTAIALADKGFKVVIPGGELRKGEFSVSGSLTEQNMQSFNVNTAIIGVGGITIDGVTDFFIQEAGIRSQVIKNANTVIAVADHSKFGVRAVCNVCKIDDIDILITDNKAPKDTLKAFEKKGVKVITVKI